MTTRIRYWANQITTLRWKTDSMYAKQRMASRIDEAQWRWNSILQGNTTMQLTGSGEARRVTAARALCHVHHSRAWLPGCAFASILLYTLVPSASFAPEAVLTRPRATLMSCGTIPRSLAVAVALPAPASSRPSPPPSPQ